MARIADSGSALSDVVRADCADAIGVASFVASATWCSVAAVDGNDDDDGDDGDATADDEAT